MAAPTERARAYFDAEDGGLYVSGYKITQQNYTDWLFSTLFKEDYDVAEGVPQLNTSAKLDVSKLYEGAAPEEGDVIKIKADLSGFEIGPVLSGITINTVAVTGLGSDYNVGWKESATVSGSFSPFAKWKHSAISSDYTITEADANTVFIVTGTTTITLPAIDTELCGLAYVIVSASGTTTIDAGSGQTLQGYDTSDGTGMDEIDTDTGSGVLANCKYITFTTPDSGTTWPVIYKGDWGTPIPQTISISPSGSTLTVDASRHVSFTTNTGTTGMTLVINNMKDTGTFTLAKTGSGTITSWPSNTYFSGTVANASEVPWTSHDLITVEKKGNDYYVDVIVQSAI